ncbi:MAG: 3-dehydroquinate synthase [Prevotella sp.]|nr:3-dehydroquinate synthase [Candidatus Prevotella equi]
MQRVIISKDLQAELTAAIADCEHDRIFVLTDTTTIEKCWPVIKDFPSLEGATTITIGATDVAKTLDSISHVWECLQKGGATRHSLMINLGGGMITDLGGFAASTFKRGINFINIPTTLLSMVDASVGGKTGINFGGLKNEIGVFNDSKYVILCTEFLKTLDDANLRSGYAEMLKHGLISTPQHWQELIAFDITNPDLAVLQRMVADSVAVKERVVEEDPHEHGIRKALNLGHTMGHAFESWAMRRNKPVLHGYAVAYGIIPELYLAVKKTNFPVEVMRQAVTYIKEVYGMLPITCDDYPELIELMTHDKKNTAGIINFTLLGGIGDIRINQTAAMKEIEEAMDFFREGL